MTEKTEPERDVAAENGRILGRIVLILLVLLLLINVPITRWGASLLQVKPQEVTSVAIREGMVLEDSQGNRYLLHNHRLRHFSSLEAYQRYSQRQGQTVQPVADRVVGQYGRGLPIYALLSCDGVDTVYALAQGEKRPFPHPPDPPLPYSNATWDQIVNISCTELAAIPTGRPIGETDH